MKGGVYRMLTLKKNKITTKEQTKNVILWHG